MDSRLRSRLQDLTLAARALLMTETRELLEGVYGLHADGRFEPADRLPALRESAASGAGPQQLGVEHDARQKAAEARQTRRRLETFLADQAVAKLIKETAFTHLNRFVAFKLMEARRLIRGTIDRYHDSNAYKFYLAASEHADDLRRHEAGDEPRDALGEGPRDYAYRRFLLWQCAQVAEEINVLFDPDTLSSHLFPRPRALRALLELLNDLSEAWQEGNEESIGWVYQYFNEPDLAIFRLPSPPKVPTPLIAAKSQQYTPRWIVRYLVHNTLGRLWLQIHPDSRLVDSLDYLVPLAGEVPREPLRPVREITILDPACGTMHFGLVAFDLLVEMYREEIENAGRPGWPDQPSVAHPDEIPTAILEHNLFGIDIDLRSVQLSALTLYLKAKTLNRAARIRESRLACADVLPLNGPRLETFLREAHFTLPMYERLTRALWTRLWDTGLAGSLVRLEAEISKLIRQERAREARLNLGQFFGVTDGDSDPQATEEEFWSIVGDQIALALHEFARQQAAKGADQSYFAGEPVKGLRILELMLRDYDIVVTNPPYLDSGDYNPVIKSYIESNYPKSKRNRYAAFLERCLEFLKLGGRFGIITPQTFMFISSYEGIRAHLARYVAIESLVRTGLNTFPDAVVDCAFYTLRQEGNPIRRREAVGTYFRLVKEPDAEAKQRAFERALAGLR